MRVEQQQKNNILDLLQQSVEAGEVAETSQSKVSTKCSKETGTKTVNMKDATYGKPGAEEKKTIAEEIEKESALDAAERKNQMTVLSNTASEEDYARMQEEGFSLDETTANTIVTVTDKIKAELAKAGVDISCFGEDLDFEQIEKITGSTELAAQLAAALQKADLPVTEDNLKDSAEAVEMVGKLQTLGDGAVKYILDNHLEPTIENLYLAEFCGSSNYKPKAPLDISPFLDQVEQIISQAGLLTSEKTVEESKWLLENDISLTPENLAYMEALRGLELPVDTGDGISAITAAISEGGRPQDAMLLPGYSLLEKAEHAAEVVENASDDDLEYIVDNGLELTIENLEAAAENRGKDTSGNTEYTERGLVLLTAKRQLEEVRLAMTAQANYALLKQGISIDTEPLVQLVDELKQAEKQYYVNLLEAQGAEASEENVALFRETAEKVSDIKDVPAYVLGLGEEDVSTVNAVHKAGMELKDVFERANERYETLMTQPRGDLGDSIQKAFRNVSDILSDLGLEVTEKNKRAVRILGYNQVEITQESVAQMKAADEEVQRVFKNLTAPVVTEMIKRGINPLEMDFETLNGTAEQIRKELGDDDGSRFSEYLWKLEQNREISEEEKSSYIGIYRLIHQVESTDGAAIGALVHQGGSFTMKNLLTAVRSERKSGKMDYTVSDETGQFGRTGYRGTSITDQVEAAYQNNCLKDVKELLTPEKLRKVVEQTPDWQSMTPEQLKTALEQASTDEIKLDQAYLKEQMAALQESAKASEDIYAILEKYDIPNTVSNIIAMQSMVSDRNQMFRQMFGQRTGKAKEEGKTEGAKQKKEQVLEELAETALDPETLTEAQEKLGELAETLRDEAMSSDEVTSLDMRELRLLSATLAIHSAFAKKEQYSVPVVINDEVVNVSLKIVRGAEKQGVVDIMMEDETHGKIAATFRQKKDGISGLIASDRAETKELLEENSAEMEAMLSGSGEEKTDVHYACIKGLDLNHFSMGTFGVEADSATEGDSASETYRTQTAKLYHIAESFIRQIREQL